MKSDSKFIFMFIFKKHFLHQERDNPNTGKNATVGQTKHGQKCNNGTNQTRAKMRQWDKPNTGKNATMGQTKHGQKCNNGANDKRVK